MRRRIRVPPDGGCVVSPETSIRRVIAAWLLAGLVAGGPRAVRAAAGMLDPSFDSRPRFALARYLSDGTLDATFGSGGLTTPELRPGSDEGVAALALEPGGHIVAAGRSDLSGAIARFTPHGSLDGSFGTGGRVATSILPNLTTFNALVRDPGGRLAVAGMTSDGVDFLPASSPWRATWAAIPAATGSSARAAPRARGRAAGARRWRVGDGCAS
jgi:uncharacterized delta-60 repeat protein